MTCSAHHLLEVAVAMVNVYIYVICLCIDKGLSMEIKDRRKKTNFKESGYFLRIIW